MWSQRPSEPGVDFNNSCDLDNTPKPWGIAMNANTQTLFVASDTSEGPRPLDEYRSPRLLKYLVCPDGSGDFLTIQAAIDAACDGDTIELCDGRFYGTGNRDIDFLGKAITVRSQNGAEACTVDCWGGYRVEPHRGFYFHSGEGPGSVLEGVTIMNGILKGSGYDNRGAGILCVGSSPKISDCRIIGNWATDGGFGGGICCDSASPRITGCVVTGNRTDGDGGGIYWSNSSSPKITSCTISGNRANRGGGLYGAGYDDRPRNTIIWGNHADSDSGSEWYQTRSCHIICCNDWDPTGHYRIRPDPDCDITCAFDGNIYADPEFCDPEPWENAPTTEGCYYIHPNSPCTPENSPWDCGLIGALSVGTLAGDCNADGVINSADIVYEINYVFKDGPECIPPEAGDVNCDGVENSADIVSKINYIFKGGPPPCCYCPQ
jgi:parallel beta-helix repeat protein